MMAWLIDSGVLVRYVQPRDPDYPLVRTAVRTLKEQGESLFFLHQNMTEFWAVSTRPAAARGGYGMSVAQADARAKLLERAFVRSIETDTAYSNWRRLLTTHSVAGVQVHDARLAASMIAAGIDHILTFNPADFERYAGITAVHPQDVYAA
jgi:predicted nucleic acid-binding protein